MRNPLNNMFTHAEQRTLLYLCLMLILGYSLQIFAWQPTSAELAADSLQIASQEDVAVNIDIRTAGQEELELLPGIGESRALAIIEYRRTNPFTSVNQVMNVRGIGLKTYQKLLPMLLKFGNSEPLDEESRASTRNTESAAPDSLSPVNLNTADLNTLCTLKGIGEVKARAIITYRTENGPFNAIEDIMNVSGIGQRTFEKNKARLRVR